MKVIKIDNNPSGEESARMIDSIIRYEQGELDEAEMIDLFSKLIKSGQAWTLQGSYGRTAKALIDNKVLPSKAEILEEMELHNKDEVGIDNQWSYEDTEYHLLLSDEYYKPVKYKGKTLGFNKTYNYLSKILNKTP